MGNNILEKKEINRKEFCKVMSSNLPILRMKANVTQNELADRLGFSRQTISAIENGKREMQWSTFTAITLFFLRDREIRELMLFLGILNSKVEEILDVEKK